MTDTAERFRELEDICKADPRWEGFVRFSEAGIEGKALEDHHARLAGIHLVEAVPEDVVIQFETAKNLSLYSWFVYRFGPVARMHAYATLELALRMYFDISRETAIKKRKYLWNLLNRAIKEGRIKEEEFSVVKQLAARRARERELFARIEELDKTGCESIEWDEEEVKVLPEDYPGDYLDKLLDSIPSVRGHIAHGSTMVDNSGPGFLQTVAEIINQLYAKPLR